MLRHFITIQLLLSLLGSGLAQASSAGMPMPVANDAAVIEVVALEDMPPCHQSQVQEQAAEQNHMACCDTDCRCDGFCPSFSFYLPNLQKVEGVSRSSELIAFSPLAWAAVSNRALYRPPIR